MFKIFKRKPKKKMWCGYSGLYEHLHKANNHERKWIYKDNVVEIIDYCLECGTYKVLEINCKKVGWVEDK